MKKKVFIAIAVVLTIGFSGQLFAQETMGVSKSMTKSPQTKGSLEQNKVVCVGKISCADGTCTINFDQEIISPRDPASGLPTGKRMHKPFVIRKELDKSSPMRGRESPTKQSTGKVSVVDFHFMGKSKTLQVFNNQFTLPENCDDGNCEIVASWSWGETNAGSGNQGTAGSGMVKKYQATFNLDVKNGEFAESKYTKTGHVTLMK